MSQDHRATISLMDFIGGVGTATRTAVRRLSYQAGLGRWSEGV